MTTPNGTGITNRGTDYSDGSQVTSTNLKAHVDNAVFNNNAVDDTTIGLNSSSPKALFVKNSGIDTAQIKDDAVTQAKASFIDNVGNMTLSGTDPKLVLDDTENGTENNGFIQSFISGNMHIETTKADSDVQLLPKDALIVKNDGTEVFRASSTAGKNATGSDAAGAKVSGHLQVTQDINCAGNHNNISIQGTAPTLTFKDSSPGATTNHPTIKSFDSGSLELVTNNAESDIILDAKDDVILQYDDNTVFRAGDGQGREADNDYVPGCKVEGALQVTGEANIGTTKLGADSILASSPSTSDDTTKIATTAFVNNLLDTFSVTAPTGSTVATSGSVALPGGLVLKFGKQATSSDSATAYTFPSAFPNNCFNVVIGGQQGGVSSISRTGFTFDRFNSVDGTQTFHFIAVGN